MDSSNFSSEVDATTKQSTENIEIPQPPDTSHRPPSPTKRAGQHIDTVSSNPLPEHTKPLNARQAKLKTSIAALESKISRTEADLSAKVHEITQLSSFPS